MPPLPAAGERDGAERAAHGAGGVGRTLRPATRLLHRRGGLGGAEPAAQRPLLRRPDGEAGPRPRAVSEGPARGGVSLPRHLLRPEGRGLRGCPPGAGGGRRPLRQVSVVGRKHSEEKS